MRTIPREGLYDPNYEHDACGIGFVVNINARASHDLICQGKRILVNLTHRGACGCDTETGDGCGILLQLPHEFFQSEAEKLGFELPAPGAYGVGMMFLPRDEESRRECMSVMNCVIEEEGQKLLGWRHVPVNSEAIGWLARESEPVIKQVFIQRSPDLDVDAFERKLYVIRKQVFNYVRVSDIPGRHQYYVPSLSARTIVYKGLFLPEAIDRFYLDLANPMVQSALALVHQRYSTNTMPSWPLAHPFRFLAHNGEINTLRGNINMMSSRDHHFSSPLYGKDVKKLTPVLTPMASDSAIFDNAFELLVRGGRDVEHAMAMMIPEPWSGHETMPDNKKAFYEYHACKMEPWDGPASIAFTDGVKIGAVRDRNGLRPSRYWVTSEDQVIMASEVGVLDIPQDKIIKKGRLEPGCMFLVDLNEKRI
ncbi:MAG: glutamate synthase subunit alpha, partial [Pedosphaera parvula]|nr:glutamate synthase subunit alpha [Pedosphaera parvula]